MTTGQGGVVQKLAQLCSNICHPQITQWSPCRRQSRNNLAGGQRGNTWFQEPGHSFLEKDLNGAGSKAKNLEGGGLRKDGSGNLAPHQVNWGGGAGVGRFPPHHGDPGGKLSVWGGCLSPTQRIMDRYPGRSLYLGIGTAACGIEEKEKM